MAARRIIRRTLRHQSDDGDLNFENLEELLSNVFSNEISRLLLEKAFSALDRNMDAGECKHFCERFLNALANPVGAFIIVDVQNDFVEGSLALKNCPAKQDGKEVIPIINGILEKHRFDAVVYTYDYHPKNHVSFFENLHLYERIVKNKPCRTIELFDTVTLEGPPETEQKLWPSHCVQNSWGSELHKDLKLVEDPISIFKGTKAAVDSYSAFFDNMKLSKTDLHRKLKERNVTHVFVCGLAFDYCVSCTARDAIDLGYATVVVRDATRGTDDINIRNEEDRLQSLNCVLAESNDVQDLLSGRDIRVEFAVTLLKSLQR